MIRLFVALVVGVTAGRLLWLALRASLDRPALQRENYRGRPVVTAAGVIVPVALVVVEAARAVVGALGVGSSVGLTGGRALVLVVALAFGLLGAVDDVLGVGDPRGFRGHVAALGRGRLTAGGLKLVGGGAVALVVAAPGAGQSIVRLVLDAVLIALCANLANLFDRRPGRVLKVSTVAFVALAVTSAAHVLVSVAVLVGAALSLAIDDLRERVMLGDAGAMVVGGALGIGVVLACSPLTRDIVLVAVAILNGMSEIVSFTRVIDAIPPLRAVDRLGRLPD